TQKKIREYIFCTPSLIINQTSTIQKPTMKNLFTCLLFLLTITLSAQEADRFTENTDDRPRDPRMDQMNFVPNEVLVKFKDEVVVGEGTTLKSARIGAVDRLLKASGVSSME